MAQGNDGKVFDLESTYKVVRELLQDDDLPEEDLRVFMRSQMFLELCPDLHRNFLSSEKLSTQAKPEVPGVSKKPIKKEKHEEDKKEHDKEKHRHSNKKEKQNNSTKIKQDQNQQKKPKAAKVLCSSSSDDDFSKVLKNTNKEDPGKNKKKKSIITVESGSSCHSSSSIDRKALHKNQEKPKGDKKSKEAVKTEEGPKVHPFYLGKMGPTVQPKGKLFQDSDEEEVEKRPKIKKKKRTEEVVKKILVRELKPWSVYNRSGANIGRGSKNWKPFAAPEFKRKQKRYKLKSLSVVCVDLVNMDTFFHKPSLQGTPSCSTSVPLKQHMNISTEKGNMIERLEKLKREAFKPVLNKIYAKSLKDRRSSRDYASSTDGERGRKVKKIQNQRRVMDSSSDSSSDPMVPKKGLQKSSMRDHGQRAKDKINARKGTAEFKVEQRKKQLDAIKSKAEQRFNNRGSRKLLWEDPVYFDPKKAAKKDDKLLTLKEREKKRLEDKLKIKTNAPAISFQKILAQIESANKEAAKKPAVTLKIPKLSERHKEYVKPSKPISVGDVAAEVRKLLTSESKIEMPIMPTETVDLADYTIRKLAWWILKSEKDPPDDVLVHPELHDHEIMEPWFRRKEDDSDDDNSSFGCVSDPEGINKCPVNEIPSSTVDGDVADEFCGLASLESRIRRHIVGTDMKDDVFKTFFKVRPLTNYEKANFEAKCFICEEKVIGTRQLGAHIRSETHKNHFRNYSLQLVTYDEIITPAVPQKIFTAKLVEYTVENPVPTESTEPEQKIELDMQITDSPRAVIDGEDNSPVVIGINEIPVDELSLPSLTMFDLGADTEQLQAKIDLKTGGVWTEEMESRWMKMQEQETRITGIYNDLREQYINAPDTHPRHDDEWPKFWNRRSCELEAEGKNPDDHDFNSEWIIFWLKRLQEIMKQDVEKEILTMKQNLGLDFESLSRLLKRHGLKSNIDGTQRTRKSDSSLPKTINVNKTNTSTEKQAQEINAESSKVSLPQPSTAISSNFKLENIEKTKIIKKNEPLIAEDKEVIKTPKDKVEPLSEKLNKDIDDLVKLKEEIGQQLRGKQEELPRTKKPLVAPPPPKLSGTHQQSSSRNDEHISNRRDSRSKDDRNNRSGKHKLDRRDSRDERRRVSPENGKSRRNDHKDDRRRGHRRSSSKEKRDRKERDRRHRTTRNSSSDSGEPSPKRHRNEVDCARVKNSEQKLEISSKVQLKNTDLEKISHDQKQNDLAIALEKLNETIKLVEPIIGDDKLILSCSPAAIENVSESVIRISNADNESLINTSVEMELEDGALNENTDDVCHKQSPIPNHIESDMEPVSPAENASSPEEGELDSNVSSVSMGVDLNHVSSFLKNKHGKTHRSKKKSRKSSTNKHGFGAISDVSSTPNVNNDICPISDGPLYPSPTKMDRTSIGFHLLEKQRRMNELNHSIPFREPSGDRRDRSDSNEYPRKRKKSKDKNNRRRSTETPIANSNNQGSSRKHHGKRSRERKDRSTSKNEYSPPGKWGETSRNFNSGHPQNNDPKSFPKPVSAQAWMDETWESEGEQIPLPAPPLPPPVSQSRPPPPPSDWEDESWEEIAKPKVRTDDKVPYSPNWDDDSNDVPCPVQLPTLPASFSGPRGQNRGRRGGRRGRRSKEIPDPWNASTNPNLIPLPSTNPVHSFPNTFNNPNNIVHQPWSNNSNPSPIYHNSIPQAFPPSQYQNNW